LVLSTETAVALTPFSRRLTDRPAGQRRKEWSVGLKLYFPWKTANILSWRPGLFNEKNPVGALISACFISPWALI